MNQERYIRQISLPGFGTAAQQKLMDVSVLVTGAGGLGSPTLQYLAAAGIGTIGIADYDCVELSNLQRQTLFEVNDIGKPKAVTAAEKLRNFNPEVKYEVHNVKIDNSNALEIIRKYDLVIDGTDNFETRYLINDACVILDKPLVYGAVMKFEGQVGVFNLTDPVSGIKSNYRDLFHEPPPAGSVASCAEAGVLGVVPAIIGSMQAAEAIKIITGIGTPLLNRILTVNVLENSFYEIEISASSLPKTGPQSIVEFLDFDYSKYGAFECNHPEISIEEFDILTQNENTCVIDVRAKDELPKIKEFKHISIPLDIFEKCLDEIPPDKEIILLCKSGKRSAMALEILRKHQAERNVRSLKGGLDGWFEKHISINTKNTQA